MKKWLLFASASLLLVGCSAESLETVSEVKTDNLSSVNIPTTNTFSVSWESNQVGAYVIFKTYLFKDCKLTETKVEVHKEKRFDVQLDNGQIFEIDIRKEESVKNPELYLSIAKGAELQYEQEVNTNGFLLQSFIDHDGNVTNP